MYKIPSEIKFKYGKLKGITGTLIGVVPNLEGGFSKFIVEIEEACYIETTNGNFEEIES